MPRRRFGRPARRHAPVDAAIRSCLDAIGEVSRPSIRSGNRVAYPFSRTQSAALARSSNDDATMSNNAHRSPCASARQVARALPPVKLPRCFRLRPSIRHRSRFATPFCCQAKAVPVPHEPIADLDANERAHRAPIGTR